MMSKRFAGDACDNDLPRRCLGCFAAEEDMDEKEYERKNVDHTAVHDHGIHYAVDEHGNGVCG